jgi:DNA polymerase/3'-5' exonuclease PolX
MRNWDNQAIADKLLELADLLEQQDANPFRVNAYRRAAETIVGHDESVAELAEREGTEGLDRLPNVGAAIARAIQEMLRTGRWQQLERLRGALDPEQVFQSIPGVGPELARRIHESLEIESLAELEVAAHDGRLEQVNGVGPRRARMIAAALAQMLRRRPERPPTPASEPEVEELLDVDREYREKAGQDQLRKIAPRRFNPEGKAWLPILHTQRGDWAFTALFSNTARAHDVGKTDDWVVL